MLGEGGTPISEFEAAVRKFLAREERGGIELKRYRAIIDALDGDFAAEAREAQQSGDLLVDGNITAASWISRNCGMSVTSAADRLCVGEQLRSLPKIAAALSSGEIGYQSAALLCHLRDQLGEKRELFDEEEMLDYARRFSVFHLRMLCRVARHAADPDGFFTEAEQNYLRRRFHISLMSYGMFAVYAVIEFVQHAIDQGTLPRRNGVRPHINLTTTLEGLKNEVGAPPADLELSLPISTRTLQRIACDSTISRVLLADSMVIDVGRATRVNSAPRRRALWVRDRGCRFTGCDRTASWSTPHHIEFWTNGGPNNIANEVLLCHYHHRLMHEGGWQVIKVGRGFRFLPPERVVMRRARGPGMRWAA